MAKFAAFRPICDKIGVALSYQQGLTLGHSAAHDGPPKPGEQIFPDSAWQVDKDGNRLGILCPRSPAVIDYERACAKAILQTARPASYWLDDDLRLGIHKPNGCFCPRCIAAFNEKTGGSWTRETLAAKLFSKAIREPVRAKWIEFNAESLALYAAALRMNWATRAASPTRPFGPTPSTLDGIHARFSKRCPAPVIALSASVRAQGTMLRRSRAEW